MATAIGDDNSKQSSGDTNKQSFGLTAEEVAAGWTPIDNANVLCNLLSGNTLTAKHKLFCNDYKSTTKECQAIVILHAMKLEEGYCSSASSTKATMIYPDDRELKNGVWGIRPYNSFIQGIDIGLINIPLDDPSRPPLKNILSVNKERNVLHLKADNGYDLYLNIQKGERHELIKQANKSGYKQSTLKLKAQPGVVALGNSVSTIMKERARVNRREADLGHKPCEGSGDSCYTITGSDKGRYNILCTHGHNTGKKFDVCSNKNGKWADGCGITGYHYDSPTEAARKACNPY